MQASRLSRRPSVLPGLLLSSFLLLILLSPHTRAQVGITSGWGEQLEVRILDGHDRPIPGAMVNVTWPINAYKWGVTHTVATDARGRAHFSIATYEFMADKVNYTFYINASYDGKRVSGSFDHRIGSQPRTLWIPAYRVDLFTRDQNGRALSLDVVADGQVRARTNENGWAQLVLAKGSRSLVASFAGSQQKLTLDVQDDRNATFVFRLYNVRIRLLDDAGNPLSIALNAGPDLYSADEQGYVNLYNLTETTLPITAIYGNFKKSMTIDLSLLNQTVLVFDTHAPVIGAPQSVYNGTTLVVSVPVSDKGDYASGMSSGQAAVMLQYTPAGSLEPRTVPMYAVGYNRFQAAITLPAGSPDVRYTIIATDADGNQAQSTDVFNIAVLPPPNKTQSTITPAPVQADLAGQFWWVGGVLLLVIIGGGYWYYVSRRPPSSMPGGTEYKYKSSEKESSGLKFPILGKPKPPELPKNNNGE